MNETPFVATLRARAETIRLGDPGAAALTIRVQLEEAWDAVRIIANPLEPVSAVKLHALEALDPSAGSPDAYVTTLSGIEILDENVSLAAAGVINGSTLLIARRNRRAVR